MKQWIIDAVFFVLLRLVCQPMPSPLRFLLDHFAFKDNQSPGFSPLVSKLWRPFHKVIGPLKQVAVPLSSIRGKSSQIDRHTAWGPGRTLMTRGWFNGGLQLLEGNLHGHDTYPVAPSLRGWGGGCKARVRVRVTSTVSRIALVQARNHIG